MKEESYSLTTVPKVFYYEFFSNGPKGIIRKLIQFQQISAGEEVYNLGFGDVDEQIGDVDDLRVSNNQDTQKVLATVAKAVVDFFEKNPHALVAAKVAHRQEHGFIK